MNAITKLWSKVHNNPWFVAFYMALGTSVWAQVQSYLATGLFNESPQYWLKTAVAAAALATASVYHLNLIPQNPTMSAVFPPSPQVEQVAAKLKPVDPNAIPTQNQKEPI